MTISAMLNVAALAGVAMLVGSSGEAAAEPAHAALTGYEEVPAISSRASALFEATLRGSSLTYKFRYVGLLGTITQAHIHFAQRGVNGAITAFLCSNLGNGPAGTPACPGPHSGKVVGVITPAQVTNFANAQGISAGEIAELLRAIRAGAAYVNLHTDLFPSGEIRGQITVDP